MKFAIDSKPQGRALTYPCLMRNATSDSGMPIVLFTSPTEGMRLTEDGFQQAEGGWVRADRSSEWVPFEGTITVTR